MSDANIPLLTDIVADSDASNERIDSEPDQAAGTANPAIDEIDTATGEIDTALAAGDPVQPETDQPRPGQTPPRDDAEELAIFEADDSRPGDTANHYMPSAEFLQDALAFDEYEIVPASLQLRLEDELPDSIAIDDAETVIAELQTRIASHVYELTDELMRAAFADLEARVFRQISTNLRQQLPELIDSVVREHLLERGRRSPEGE